jgi:hypothetical protein
MSSGGVLPPTLGQPDGGLFDRVLAGGPNNAIDANRNAILGYLAGALAGGNLGQSIGRGLAGYMGGGQRDAAQQTQHAALHYVAQQGDIEPALKAALLRSPALALHYLQTRANPHTTRDIAEYEYAKRQGFNGTLADFIERKRAGAAPPQE